MLVIYRTNPGFAGQVVSLDYQTPAVAMDRYLASEHGADLAYLEVDGRLLKRDLLADLLTAPGAVTVDHKAGALVHHGRTADLGYTPGAAETAERALREDATIQALLGMSDAELATWLSGKTTGELFRIVFRALRHLLRASRVVA